LQQPLQNQAPKTNTSTLYRTRNKFILCFPPADGSTVSVQSSAALSKKKLSVGSHQLFHRNNCRGGGCPQHNTPPVPVPPLTFFLLIIILLLSVLYRKANSGVSIPLFAVLLAATSQLLPKTAPKNTENTSTTCGSSPCSSSRRGERDGKVESVCSQLRDYKFQACPLGSEFLAG
jgi:hypothetical protein